MQYRPEGNASAAGGRRRRRRAGHAAPASPRNVYTRAVLRQPLRRIQLPNTARPHWRGPRHMLQPTPQ
eukprot:2929949-Lingulodinium_polyedra.AAC.1